MHFDILSVFPEVFAPYLDASIMGRAQKAGIFDFTAHDLRKWTHDRHHSVDDAPFGGGQGMLMKPAPIFEAVRDIASPLYADIVFNVLSSFYFMLNNPPWNSSDRGIFIFCKALRQKAS